MTAYLDLIRHWLNTPSNEPTALAAGTATVTRIRSDPYLDSSSAVAFFISFAWMSISRRPS